jgi:siroheme synthase-like protein
MGFVPIFIDVAGLPIAVIGGDDLAEQRVGTLLEAGALVTVISPTLTRPLTRLAADGRVRYFARSLIAGDLRDYGLAYCTSDDPDQSRAAVADARAHGVPINVTDQPQLCRFIVPAVVKRGDLQIAVSTGGASPALAKLLRLELQTAFGPAYATLTAILKAARHHLRQRYPDGRQRAPIASAMARDLRDALISGDRDQADRILQSCIGLRLDELVDRAAVDIAMALIGAEASPP